MKIKQTKKYIQKMKKIKGKFTLEKEDTFIIMNRKLLCYR